MAKLGSFRLQHCLRVCVSLEQINCLLSCLNCQFFPVLNQLTSICLISQHLFSIYSFSSISCLCVCSFSSKEKLSHKFVAIPTSLKVETKVDHKTNVFLMPFFLFSHHLSYNFLSMLVKVIVYTQHSYSTPSTACCYSCKCGFFPFSDPWSAECCQLGYPDANWSHHSKISEGLCKSCMVLSACCLSVLCIHCWSCWMGNRP